MLRHSNSRHHRNKVVCDELDDCAWNLGLYQFSDKCVYVYCVESFAHIECYSDCSRIVPLGPELW